MSTKKSKKKKKKKSRKSHNIYVIRLDDSIYNNEWSFRDKNPGYQSGMPCVYVGMTGRTPDERFSQHKKGYKSAKYAKKYGQELMREEFEKHNPMSYDEASEMEKKKTVELRKKGYAVWSN